jgi:caffeoyl-CoA O-methyltransferase
LPGTADAATIVEMDITTPAIEDYLKQMAPQEDPILGEMEARAQERNFPIIGPLVGRLLYQLVRLTGARKILELGSGFGYSAYWFGRALEGSGEVILTELSPENLGLAKDFLQRGGVSSQLQFHQGDALEILKDIKGPFDIIFNDVDKHQYPEAFKKAGSLLARGGLFISDNVLWQGQVVEQADPDENTRGILEHNRLIFESPDFYSSILPVRDGISLSVKH